MDSTIKFFFFYKMYTTIYGHVMSIYSVQVKEIWKAEIFKEEQIEQFLHAVKRTFCLNSHGNNISK